MSDDWHAPTPSSRPTGVYHDEILFSEAEFEGPVIRTVRVEISRQNSNLSEVKTRMAREARSVGANAIVAFTYGQAAHPWWKQFLSFKWDSESWFGEGNAIRID